jgi:hypothetical protein
MAAVEVSGLIGGNGVIPRGDFAMCRFHSTGPDYKTRVWLLASKNPKFFEIYFARRTNKGLWPAEISG